MNQIYQSKYVYLSPNETIETILILSQDNEFEIYVYNYKGISFRIFRSRNKLEGFWKGLNDEDLHFNSEKDLDHWLNFVAS